MTSTKLRLTIVLGDDEHHLSAASRAAARNGRDSVQRFCADLGVNFWRLADGRAAELSKLAELASLDLPSLERNTIVRDDRGFRLRGQHLLRTNLRRNHVRVCPACLQEDLHRWPDIRVDTRPYGRVQWQLRSIRTCPSHRMGLVEIATCHNAATLHDFTAAARRILNHIDALEAGAPRRGPSLLERYLAGRLDGEDMPRNLLDDLPFSAAATVGEVIGAAAAFGAEVRVSRLTDEQWRQAGDAAIRIAREGKDAVQDLLAHLPREQRNTSGIWNFKPLFRQLEEWLSAGHGAETIAGAERTRSYTVPTSEGVSSDVCGEDPASVTTLRTAVLATGRHPKRVRKVLAAAGHLEHAEAWLPDGLAKIDVTPEAEALLAAMRNAMSLTQAGLYLNAPRVQVKLLFEAGFIKPFLAADEILKDYAFAREDLDSFLSSLRADAREASGDDLVDIPSAAKRANCSAAEIVTLILAKRLCRIGLSTNVHGYMGVTVDTDEVRGLVRREDHGGLSLRETERRLETSTAVVTNLLEHGHLPSSIVVNPVNRCPQRAVLPVHLERFMTEYGSLQVIARERGIHFRRLKKTLMSAGVVPAFDPDLIKATFYRRSDLPPP